MRSLTYACSVAVVALLAACQPPGMPDGADGHTDGAVVPTPEDPLPSSRLLITGDVSNVRTDRAVVSGHRDISSIVTHIGAFPIVAQGVGSDPYEGATIGDVDSTGGFELDLDRNQDWILLLLSANQAGGGHQVLGYVSIRNGEESLVLFPADYILEDLDLGGLIQVNDEAESTLYEDNADIYAISPGELDQLAEMDDVFKLIKNSIMNYDAETGTGYWARLSYHLHAPLADVINGYALPGEYDQRAAFAISIRTNNTSHPTKEEILAADGLLRIVPPYEFTTWREITYGPDAPFDNLGVAITDQMEDGSCGYTADGHVGGFLSDDQHGFGIHDIPFPVGEGDWSLQYDGEELAVFDVGVADPTDGEGHYTMFIPTIRATVDAEGRVGSIEVQWYRWDEDLAAYGVVDIDTSIVFSELVTQWSVNFTDSDGTDHNDGIRIDEGIDGNPLITADDFEHEWHVGIEDGSKIVSDVGISVHWDLANSLYAGVQWQ